jgi:hypothetical protein
MVSEKPVLWLWDAASRVLVVKKQVLRAILDYRVLNPSHNGLQLLRLPAERRESTPVETAMQSPKQ